jgi:hypothetical protein
MLSCACVVCPHDFHLKESVPEYEAGKIRGGSFPTVIWVSESIGTHFGPGLVALYGDPCDGPPTTYTE